MGRVVHFEFFAEDPGASAGFFARLFGWRVQQWGDEPYWLVGTGPAEEEGIDGAFAPPSLPSEQRVVNTVDVDDLDDVIRQAEEAGGRVVVPKRAVPGVGWVAYLADPSGLVFAAMQSDWSAQP